MVGLVDIGKVKRTVNVQGVDLEVQGLSSRGLFDLLDLFPEIRKLLSDSGVAVSAVELMKHAPDAVSTVGAYVLGYRKWVNEMPDDPITRDRLETMNKEFKAAVDLFDELMIGDQTEIIKTAWGITFPRGTAAFLEALEAVGAIESGKVQATASPGPLKS